MTKAIWNGAIIAESDRCITVEGNRYFPADSIKAEYLQNSNTCTTCSWKGVANYFHVVVDNQFNPDAAWYYPNPTSAARHIQGYIAFWRGVSVED